MKKIILNIIYIEKIFKNNFTIVKKRLKKKLYLLNFKKKEL